MLHLLVLAHGVPTLFPHDRLQIPQMLYEGCRQINAARDPDFPAQAASGILA